MQRCSKKAYAMCPTRHLCGPIEEATFSDDSECATFNREVEDKPMTNADRIRAMSDEELADWLARTQIDNVAEVLAILKIPYEHEGVVKDKVAKECLEWLQQKAEGE